MSLIKPAPRQPYRSTLGIDVEILESCMDAGLKGLMISELSRKTNLSHNAVINNCSRLIEAGLMNSVRTDKHNIFMINEKGIKFFHEIQRFQDKVKELNLRY